jgi:hypothetical protein
VRVRIGQHALDVKLPAPAALSGRVLLPDGSPAEEFTVVIDRDSVEYSRSLDSKHGTFLAEGLAPGRVRVYAWHISYWSESKELELRPGVEHGNVLIRLRNYARLYAWVTDARGEIVDAARVELEDVETGERVYRGGRESFFDAWIASVRPGRYRVLARTSRRRTEPREITLEEGETTWIELVLPD